MNKKHDQKISSKQPVYEHAYWYSRRKIWMNKFIENMHLKLSLTKKLQPGFTYMFKTACNSGVITLWGWPEFLLTGNGSRFASYLVHCSCNCCAAQQEGSHAMLCTSSLSCWQSDGQHWILIPYPPTRSQSNGLAHRVGTRDIVWQLATLSVQLYFPCTPSSQGVGGSTAATNSLGLSQSPFPLFSLRPSSVFSLSSDCLGSRQTGWTQEKGLGSKSLHGLS